MALPTILPCDSLNRPGDTIEAEMRCALECPIEAKIKLPRDLDSLWFNGKRLIIRRDDSGYASVIRIEGKVAEDDMIKMVVEKLPNGMTHFSSSGGIKIREELEEELKLVESTLLQAVACPLGICQLNSDPRDAGGTARHSME